MISTLIRDTIKFDISYYLQDRFASHSTTMESCTYTRIDQQRRTAKVVTTLALAATLAVTAFSLGGVRTSAGHALKAAGATDHSRTETPHLCSPPPSLRGAAVLTHAPRVDRGVQALRSRATTLRAASRSRSPSRAAGG